MKKTALIMAGGKGERFWPKSRQTLPKQFLSLTNDGKTMIQLTVERILPIVNLDDIYIATNALSLIHICCDFFKERSGVILHDRPYLRELIELFADEVEKELGLRR